jgi:hypothetical protein
VPTAVGARHSAFALSCIVDNTLLLLSQVVAATSSDAAFQSYLPTAQTARLATEVARLREQQHEA